MKLFKKTLQPHLKIFIFSFVFALFLLGIFTTINTVVSAQSAQSHIAESVLRLHVLANSDSPADQSLKLTVRDSVLAYMQTLPPTLNPSPDTLENARQIAQQTVYDNGYSYPVRVQTGKFNFPTKIYGDIALPPGEYNAIRIEIGDAEGQNWWCVIYPNICVAGTTANLPEQSKSELQTALTPEEYQLITGESPIKFRVLEFLN